MIVHIKFTLIAFGVIVLQHIECQKHFYPRLRRSAGGRIASIENHPYMASIRLAGKHTCGGTIISKDLILTAGTCIGRDDSLDLLYVKVGAADINVEGSWHQIAKVVVHEQFDGSSDDTMPQNDIALVKLRTSIDLNNQTTGIIELFGEDDNVQNYDRGVSAGWGRIISVVEELVSKNDTSKPKKKVTNPYSSKLRDVELAIGSVSTCSSIYPDIDPEKNFCTHTLGKIMCFGDNGGPFVVDGRQAGIVSGQSECEGGSSVTYFVSVAKYRKWIDEHVKLLLSESS